MQCVVAAVCVHVCMCRGAVDHVGQEGHFLCGVTVSVWMGVCVVVGV